MPKKLADKQVEAQERQEAYDSRSAGEQMELILARPGNSRKEFARLTVVQGELDRLAALKDAKGSKVSK